MADTTNTAEDWVGVLPSGDVLWMTRSKSSQQAVAKTMMCDVPTGTRVAQVKEIVTNAE